MTGGARKLATGSGAIAALSIALLMGCTARAQAGKANAAATRAADGQNFERIERGRYLTRVADCAACHTDPEREGAFAGGRPIGTPFGVLAAPNITPDGDTGIGNWSDEQFDAAVREGRMPDGSRLYPAMPYPYYTKMSRADVLAIRAYLDTVPPVHRAITSNQLPFPYKMRSLMRFWDALYFTPGEFQADPAQSAQRNRGAYLIEGPGHCGACHTPKTSLGGDELKREFQGYSIQGWFAPNITNDESSGLGRWSEVDIVEYLKRGHNRVAAAAGPMGEEVVDSSSKISDADLAAMADYLKHTPGQSDRARPVASSDPMMTAGSSIYEDLCSACHQKDGTGVAYLFPNIAAASSVASRDPTTLIRVVLQGAQSVATDAEPTGPAMPAYGWQLTDAQVAAVTTYVRNSWMHAAPAVTEREVRAARDALAAENR